MSTQLSNFESANSELTDQNHRLAELLESYNILGIDDERSKTAELIASLRNE